MPTESVSLVMTSKRELQRLEAGSAKSIAADVRKTGYSKIAQLVEMPPGADMTQAEKYSPSHQEDEEDEEEVDDELNVTKNPQSKTSGTGKQQASYQNVKSNRE